MRKEVGVQGLILDGMTSLGTDAQFPDLPEASADPYFTQVRHTAEVAARVVVPECAKDRVAVFVYGSTAWGSRGRGLDLILIAADAQTARDVIGNTCVVDGRVFATWTYNRRPLEFVMNRRGYVFMHVSPSCWTLMPSNVRERFPGSKSMLFSTETLDRSLDPGDRRYSFVAARLRSRLLPLPSFGSTDMLTGVRRAVQDARSSAAIIALARLASRKAQIRVISLKELMQEVLDFGYQADPVRRPMGEADKAARIIQEWGHQTPRGFALRALAGEYAALMTSLKTTLTDPQGSVDDSVIRARTLMDNLAIESIDIYDEGYLMRLVDKHATVQTLAQMHQATIVNNLRAEFWNVVSQANFQSARVYLRTKWPEKVP
jgi:hypothetical protein